MVPFRVLAPHRWPGQSGPNRKLFPFWNLPFAILKITAFIRFYYAIFAVALRDAGCLVHGP